MLTSGKIKIEHYKCQRDKHNSSFISFFFSLLNSSNLIFKIQLDKEKNIQYSAGQRKKYSIFSWKKKKIFNIQLDKEKRGSKAAYLLQTFK